MKIEKDGNAYCVKADNFVNLQESKDYFYIEKDEYQRFIESHNQELKEIVERIEENAVTIHKGELRQSIHGWLIDPSIIKSIKEEYGIEE